MFYNIKYLLKFANKTFICTEAEVANNSCRFSNGNQILDFIGFNNESVAIDIIILFFYLIASRIITWFALLIVAHRKSKF